MDARKLVLVVDDDADSRRAYRGALERAGYAAVVADSAEAALAAAFARRPDAVVSDVRMSGLDGLALCERLRGEARTAGVPILLMSGMNKKEADQLEGLERGADDYLVKPFSFKYLIAKVAAVLRRFEAPQRLSPILAAEKLVLDVSARTVTCAGRGVRLTRKEFDLLTAFLERPGRVLSARFLLERVWGYDLLDYDDPHTVTVHLSSLRRKLGAFGRRIVSVPAVGYRFDPAGKLKR